MENTPKNHPTSWQHVLEHSPKRGTKCNPQASLLGLLSRYPDFKYLQSVGTAMHHAIRLARGGEYEPTSGLQIFKYDIEVIKDIRTSGVLPSPSFLSDLPMLQGVVLDVKMHLVNVRDYRKDSILMVWNMLKYNNGFNSVGVTPHIEDGMFCLTFSLELCL